MSAFIRLLFVVGGALWACSPKAEHSLSAESSPDSSSENTAEPTPCGDSIAEPNVYCFNLISAPGVVDPEAVVSIDLEGRGTENFAAFSFQGISLLRWKNENITMDEKLKQVALGSFGKAVAMNLVGTPIPDILLTNILEANILRGANETLTDIGPVGLPQAARAEDGHTIPIDVGGDAKIEYLKGGNGRATLWSKKDDTWTNDGDQFEVPGCQVLVDFGLGDFDGDGLTDVAYIGSAENVNESTICGDPALHSVMVITQSETGHLVERPRLAIPGRKLLQVHVGDFDGSGLSDILVVADDFELWAFRATGDGHFADASTIGKTLVLAVGNVDGDTMDEIVMFTKTRDTKIADDPFGELKFFTWPELTGVPRALGDLNNDNVDDIAFVDIGADPPSLSVAISNP